MDFYTKQSATWTEVMNLPKLLYQSVSLTLTEFTTALRFEVFYWIENYAFCLNLLYYIEPINIKIITNNAVAQCSTTLIDQIHEWTIWEDIDATLIDDCSLSSGTDVTMYEYIPIIDTYYKYFLGADLF